MNITQANTEASVRQDAFSLSSGIRPMLVRPRFMKETDLLLHVPFLFWLMDAVRPARSTIIGLGDGVAYLAICQAIEEFSIQGRCTGIRFRDDSKDSAAPRSALKTFDTHAERLYEGMADLRDYAALDEAWSDIQPSSLDLLFVDLCEISQFSDWMEKLAPGGCLVVHGLGEGSQTLLSLKESIQAASGYVVLFFDFGAGLAVVLKEKAMTDAARDVITLDGSGCYRKADSLLLRRLGQGLAAIARNGNIARQLDKVRESHSATQERCGKMESDLATLNEAYEARNRKIWELQATGFDRKNENRDLHKHQQALGDTVEALKSALETIRKEKDSVAEALSEKLRQERESHFKETGILTRLLEDRNSTRQAEMNMLCRQVKKLSDHNAALLSSTSWRITAPIRKIKQMLTGK